VELGAAFSWLEAAEGLTSIRDLTEGTVFAGAEEGLAAATAEDLGAWRLPPLL